MDFRQCYSAVLPSPDVLIDSGAPGCHIESGAIEIRTISIDWVDTVLVCGMNP